MCGNQVKRGGVRLAKWSENTKIWKMVERTTGIVVLGGIATDDSGRAAELCLDEVSGRQRCEIRQNGRNQVYKRSVPDEK